MDIAIARIILSIVFGIGIGLIMALIFRKDDAARDDEANNLFAAHAKVPSAIWVFWVLMLALLIFGTLQIRLLTNHYAEFNLMAADERRMLSSW